MHLIYPAAGPKRQIETTRLFSRGVDTVTHKTYQPVMHTIMQVCIRDNLLGTITNASSSNFLPPLLLPQRWLITHGQQNVTLLHRMVQQLGTARDTGELRGQCRCQLQVIGELREKIQAQMRLQQQQAEGASRQDAARLSAMNSKLTKDFNRVNAIALDLGTQAERRMREVDAQRQSQVEEDEERARVAFAGAGGGQPHGMVQLQQRRERVQMQEEAINTAIIQETEEELQQINKSLYKVNEIYRDLANIVEQQQEAVEEIETNTEGAHARAQEGLVQVQKANDYQPSCVVS
ncbi:unnamed protein product [Ectocarpus sp. 6 AP-2014]